MPPQLLLPRGPINAHPTHLICSQAARMATAPRPAHRALPPRTPLLPLPLTLHAQEREIDRAREPAHAIFSDAQATRFSCRKGEHGPRLIPVTNPIHASPPRAYPSVRSVPVYWECRTWGREYRPADLSYMSSMPVYRVDAVAGEDGRSLDPVGPRTRHLPTLYGPRCASRRRGEPGGARQACALTQALSPKGREVDARRRRLCPRCLHARASR